MTTRIKSNSEWGIPRIFLSRQAKLELRNVFLGAFLPVDDRVGIIAPDQALGFLLYGNGSKVRFVYEAGWKVLQFGHPKLDEICRRGLDIEARFSVGTWVVEPEVGHGKGRYSRQPEPVRIIQSPVAI